MRYELEHTVAKLLLTSTLGETVGRQSCRSHGSPQEMYHGAD
jgi:hypothetical protein